MTLKVHGVVEEPQDFQGIDWVTPAYSEQNKMTASMAVARYMQCE